MARRKRHRRKRNPGMIPAALANPRRRRRHRNEPGRRHRRRRNNPGMGRGIAGQVMQGAVDGAGVVVGKAFSRAIPALVGLNLTGVAGVAIQAAATVVGGFVGSKLNRNFGRMMVAGGLAGIIEGYVKALNIPVLSPALGDEYDAALQHGLSAYTLPGSDENLGLYPGFSGTGDEAYEREVQDSIGMSAG